METRLNTQAEAIGDLENSVNRIEETISVLSREATSRSAEAARKEYQFHESEVFESHDSQFDAAFSDKSSVTVADTDDADEGRGGVIDYLSSLKKRCTRTENTRDDASSDLNE